MEVYNWGTNSIQFTDPDGLEVDLQLRGRITIVKGCSGSGRTLICEKLKWIAYDINPGKKYTGDKIFLVLQPGNIKEILNQKNKLVIIDRADFLVDEDTADSINKDFNNRYLIFSRKNLGIAITPNHVADLIFDEKFKLEYRFSIPGWC